MKKQIWILCIMAIISFTFTCCTKMDDSLVNLQGYKKSDNSITNGEGYSYSDGPPPQHINIENLEKVHELIYPVYGMPSIVEKGGELTVLIRLQDGGGTTDWGVIIRTDDILVQSHELLGITQTYITNPTYGDIYRLDCWVPKHATEDIYDIVVTSASLPEGFDSQPSAVKVVDPIDYGNETFTFVHITDNQTRDPGTYLPPLHDRRYLIEYATDMIKLLNPKFVIHTGDWNFGMDYGNEHSGEEDEYEENYTVYWSNTGFPMFMVPGNHDGYASFDGCYVLPPCSDLHVNRDGLEYWQQYLGPQYYSFDYGHFHFICMNAYDGEPIRRDTYGQHGILAISVWNWGGELEEDQEAWYQDDAEEADNFGMENILSLHQDPRGPYKEDWWTWECKLFKNPCWVWPPRIEGQVWNYDGPETGGSETPEDNTGTRLRSFILDPLNNFSHVFYGHEHVDQDEMDGHVRYIQTTTTCVGPYIDERTGEVVTQRSIDDYKGTEYGFRLVKVEDGVITEVNYKGFDEQSIPIIFGDPDQNPPPNLELIIDPDDRNDGTDPTITVIVTNRLVKDMDVTIEFYVPGEYIYKVKGGTIREVGISQGSDKVVYAQATAPAQSNHIVSISPVSNPRMEKKKRPLTP